MKNNLITNLFNTWNCQKRSLITDYKCSKCGKIKRLTATTPH